MNDVKIVFPESPVAVVVPAYQAGTSIVQVIQSLPGWVSFIVVVDDASRDSTADLVAEQAQADARIRLLRHVANQGVGGAVLDGYREAAALGASIIVKMDSDGQMDPAYLRALIQPILERQADYTKGNRFLHLTSLKAMPLVRRIGNLGLSFLTKLCSGFWNIFDPTNGYTALHASLLPLLDEGRIHRRYFFESSLLMELYFLRAVVQDVYIPAHYNNEKSSLSVSDSLLRFPPLLLRGFLRRVLVNYFIKDFTAVSVLLVSGIPMLLFGLVFGIYHWVLSIVQNVPATTGTVMVAALPFILGFQLLLQALLIDTQNIPTRPIQK